MQAMNIVGGRVLLPGGIEETALRIEGGLIAGFDPGPGPVLDAAGLLVAPGIVDIHGDAFERQVMPRPGVYFPLDIALLDTDRQLATNGITTAYHALTLSWEPGLRAPDRGAAMIAALEDLAPRLSVDHRVQLRWETFADGAFGLVHEALGRARNPLLAFNDHTSSMLRAFDVSVQDRPFEQSPAFRTADWDDPRLAGRVAGSARRAGLSDRDYLALMRQVWERRGAVDGNIRSLAARARETGAAMLSHDDSQLETRAYYRGLGARIAEFPMTPGLARAAHDAGDAVVFGAPNVVRGGSHIGSPVSADMVEAGWCTVLASDYAYPAMLGAARRLHDERRAPIERIWAALSTNPARAAGLTDRGEIAPGQRADLVALDWPEGATPAVAATLSAGRIAHLSGDLLR